MSSSVASKTASAAVAKATAPHQGGVLDGVNPAHYDTKNPLILFIIQVRGRHCLWSRTPEYRQNGSILQHPRWAPLLRGTVTLCLQRRYATGQFDVVDRSRAALLCANLELNQKWEKYKQ